MILINLHTEPRKREPSWLRQTFRRPSIVSTKVETFSAAALAVCPKVSISASRVAGADQPGGQSP